MLSNMLRNMASLVKGVIPSSQPLIDAMASHYLGIQQRYTAVLTSNQHVVEALRGYWSEEPDEDVLMRVRTAMRYAPTPGEARGAWLMLTPAPKIYEIYVLIKIAEALKKKYRGDIETCEDMLHCYRVVAPDLKPIEIYYNRPPTTLSRVIHQITGSTPHPDILLVYKDEEKRIVIDAKYKLNLSIETRKLKLDESLRLLGYLMDLAHNKDLHAIIAVPKKTKGRDKITQPLNDIAINIQITEINPQTNIDNLTKILP